MVDYGWPGRRGGRNAGWQAGRQTGGQAASGARTYGYSMGLGVIVMVKLCPGIPGGRTRRSLSPLAVVSSCGYFLLFSLSLCVGERFFCFYDDGWMEDKDKAMKRKAEQHWQSRAKRYKARQSAGLSGWAKWLGYLLTTYCTTATATGTELEWRII